jgi:hypothetical protein
MTSTPDPTLEPFDANEADVAEQRQELDGGGTASEPVVAPDQAAEADALEQGASVGDDDGDEAYPHRSQEDVD